jgi:hypothetical protein
VRLGPYSLAELRVRIAAPRAVADQLGDALRDLRDDGAADAAVAMRITQRGADRFGVRLGSGEAARNQPASDVPYCVMQMLDSAVAARWSATGVAIHGSVVERDGVALALVGYSGVGKSTLAAAAVGGGFRYVSDELALVDGEGSVHRYHRPLGMRAGPLDALLGWDAGPGDSRVRLVPASHLGALGNTSRLGMVILIERGPIGADAGVSRVRPAQAMSSLLNNLPGTEGHEEAVFRRLHRLVLDVPTVSLSRGPLDAMVRRLDECHAGVVQA